jgi:hypothetical protein
MPRRGIGTEAIEERKELSRCAEGALSPLRLQNTKVPSRPGIERRFGATRAVVSALWHLHWFV